MIQNFKNICNDYEAYYIQIQTINKMEEFKQVRWELIKEELIEIGDDPETLR
jgi:hypothetical protein